MGRKLGMENGLSQFLFHDSRTFGLVLLVNTGVEILVEVNARLRAMIAQNEDAELEHN
jgi:hypothetical protein